MLADKRAWESFLRQEKEGGEYRSWSEALLLTGGFLLICLWLRPVDPFFLASHFPWPWLVPIHIALRHGSKAGIIASVTLALGWELFRWSHPYHEGMHPGFFLGGFIVTLSCGEFRDLWFAHIHRERKSREHLDHRLDALTRAHHVLQLSHDRLQGAFLAHPPTMRDTLTEICGLGSWRLSEEASQTFLAMLARFFQLEVGALYPVKDGLPLPEALAGLGPARPLDGKDPLVAACRETGELCHALAEGRALRSPYLFVAPLAASTGETLALLAVEKLPFFAFHEENLRALYSVMGYYADRVRSSQLASRVTAVFPDCPEDFAAEYLRLHRLGGKAGLESALAALRLPGNAELAGENAGNDAAGMIARMRERGRSLDLFWTRRLPGSGTVLLALLPLCGESQAMAYLTRVVGPAPEGAEEWHGVRKVVSMLSKGDALENLAGFFRGLEAPSQIRSTVHG